MDRFLVGFDKALRVIAGVAAAQRPSPAAALPDEQLEDSDRRLSAGLMRVNHVGEVCAQALYEAQGRFSSDPAIREQFSSAAREEEDHLAWTALRLKELGSHPSLLNPLWYAGAYTLGALAAKAGDKYSLGFVVETERQVEAHLSSHLEKLPVHDVRSRVVVEQMRLDEIAHGAAADSLGAEKLPVPLQNAMTAMSRVMTTVAYYL